MSERPIVTLEDGRVQGSTKIDWKGGKYYSFQGIPYAKPPVGNLRFKPPQPVEPWTGIKDASKEGSDCYSRSLFTQTFCGSEDCLFVNVYTPQIPTGDKNHLKPVMVWIHGGAFICGSGSTELYGPDFLVAEDVVIVTINYRLGLLGFAYFTDPKLGVPGNAGLKDQVYALKWVQKNISKFSGDPNNVTIFGESAGGSSVHLLMLSPLSKGLFHKVISQSGVATAHYARGQPTAPVVAKLIDMEGASEAEVAKALTDLPIEKLFELQEKLPQPQAVAPIRPFGLVIEKPSASAFLEKDPQDSLSSGSYNHVPLMIGFTSKEGMLFEYVQRMAGGDIKWPSDFETFLPFTIPKESELSKCLANSIKQFYYGDETPSMENIDQYYKIYTDAYFFININNAVRDHTKTSKFPTYYYRMSLDTRLNLFKKMANIPGAGASHGDDIGYLFKTFGTPDIRPKTAEYLGVNRFVKLWVSFAKHGDPNPKTPDKLINITWLPTEPNKLHFLEIGDNLTVGVDPEAERVELWDEIYHSYLSKNKL